MVVKVKDQRALVMISQVASWLDERRWQQESRPYYSSFKDDLTAQELILTHWLTYVTNRQMPADRVFDYGAPVFGKLAREFSRVNLAPKKTLDRYYHSALDKKGNKRFRFQADEGASFAPRFVTVDYQSLLQTLEVLSNSPYGRSLPRFIVGILEKYRGKSDLLGRVACALHLLTYELDSKKANAKRTLKVLKDEDEFAVQLAAFKKNSTTGKKRLWCAIRDFKKGPLAEMFAEAIHETAGKDAGTFVMAWNELPNDQIELPGDIWNNSPYLKANLFARVLEASSTWGMPKIVRTVFSQTDELERVGFYPEQLDVSFDFVPRMCERKLCDVCPFGARGAGSICIPTDDQNCPVALVSCGYIGRCIGRNSKCIIRDGVGKGVCEPRA